MASSHPLVERFRTGEVPEPLKAAAARGALPLPAEDLVEILFHLRKDPSKEIQRDVVRTLEGLPVDAVLAVAAPDAPPAMLDFLARASIRREPVLEHVIKHAQTADATLVLLAQHGSESVLEFLSFNQVRLARAPAIGQAMLQNPRMTVSIRRRLEEMAQLHAQEMGQQQRMATQAKAKAGPAAPAEVPPAVAPAPPPPPPVSAPAPAVPEPAPAPAPPVPGTAPDDASPEGEPPTAEALQEDLESLADLASAGIDQRILDEMAADDATEEELRLAQKLLTMTVPEKVSLAMKGNREARMVLIRDASKQVQEAVVNSPKLTDNEVERIAKMRSISDDVIRLLSTKREAMKIYSVVSALVHNPKTPTHISMSLMQQLQTRDIQQIAKDKNIPDAVRRHALITLDKRKPKATPKK